jgi:hypothetical protein
MIGSTCSCAEHYAIVQSNKTATVDTKTRKPIFMDLEDTKIGL